MLSKVIKYRTSLQTLTSRNKIQIYRPKYNNILTEFHPRVMSDSNNRLDYNIFLQIFPWKNYRRPNKF